MNLKLFFKIVSVFAVETFMLSLSGARAAEWTGEINDQMDNPMNWNPLNGINSASGTFNADAALTNNPILNNDFTINSLVFQTAGWTLGGSGTLSLTSSGWGLDARTINSGTITINHGIKITAAQSWGVGNLSTSTAIVKIYGNLAGASNLTINSNGSSGLLSLYGSAAAYTGTISIINASAVGLGHSEALGAKAIVNGYTTLVNVTNSPLTVATDLQSNGRFRYGRANWGVDAPTNSTLLLTGTLNAAGADNYFEVYSGTLVLAGQIVGTGTAIIGRANTNDQNGSLVLAGDNRGFSGTINFMQGAPSGGTPSGALTATYINSAHAFGNAQEVRLASNNNVFDNSSGAAVRIATSNTIKLGNNNTTRFLGTDNLDLGDGRVEQLGGHTFLVEKNTLALGTLVTSNFALTKSGAGTLLFNGDVGVGASQTVTISGGLLAVRGAFTSAGGNLNINSGQFASHGVINSGLSWASAGGTLAAGLAAYGGDLTVNLGGSGATYNWGGGLFSNNQTLVLGHALSDGTVDIQNGVNLNINNVARTVEVVSGSAKIDARFSGVITGGNVGTNLTKTGNGVLELAGNNNYAGWTTVAEGTLLVSGTASTQRPYTVNAGATLGGHGTIILSGTDVNVSGVLDVSGGGVLDDIGTLTLNLGAGVLNLSAAEGLGFILGADGDSDQIKLLGSTGLLWNPALTLNDFNFTLGSGFTGDGTYELMVSDSVLLSSFTDLTGTIGGGAYDATLSLTNSHALTLTVTAIPEPSALLLMLGGTALLLALRRWKNPK